MLIAFGFLALMMLALAIGLAILICHNAAKKKQQASYVKTGTIELVMAGATCVDLLANVPGYHFEPGPSEFKIKVGRETSPGKWELVEVEVPVSDAVIPDNGHGEKRSWLMTWLRKRWGFFWVSLFYPQHQIHRFEIPKTRLKSNLGPNTKIGDMIGTDPAPTEVDNLRWRFPRPVIIHEVEFGDRLTADLLVLINVQAVMPIVTVLYNMAKFFTEIEGMVESALVEVCRKKRLQEFLADFPLGASNPEFHARVTSLLNEEMIRRFGVEIITSWVVAIELGDSEEQKALKANELAQLQGQAAITRAKLAATEAKERAIGVADAKAEEARGEAEAKIKIAGAEAAAIRLVGEAEAAALKAQVDGAGEKAVVANLNKKGLEGFKGQALSQGGQGSGIIVQLPAKEPDGANNN